jgi:hypothetical protein
MNKNQAIAAMYQGKILTNPNLIKIGARWIYIAQPALGIRDNRGNFLFNIWGYTEINFEDGWVEYEDQTIQRPHLIKTTLF